MKIINNIVVNLVRLVLCLRDAVNQIGIRSDSAMCRGMLRYVAHLNH